MIRQYGVLYGLLRKNKYVIVILLHKCKGITRKKSVLSELSCRKAVAVENMQLWNLYYLSAEAGYGF